MSQTLTIPPIFPRGPSQRNCILSEDSGLSRRMGLEPDLESLATPMLVSERSRIKIAWLDSGIGRVSERLPEKELGMARRPAAAFSVLSVF